MIPTRITKDVTGKRIKMITSRNILISAALLTSASAFNIIHFTNTIHHCSKPSFLCSRPSFQLDLSAIDGDGNDLKSWTVVQLKDELKRLNLKVSGNKDELIQRLLDNNQDKERVDDSSQRQAETSSSSKTTSPPKTNNVQILKHDEIEVTSFDQLNLINSLRSSINLQGWEQPTPIQQLAIPTILKHFSDDNESSCTSIWAEAPTGSGKTGAFALPLIQLTLEEKKKTRMKRLSSRDKKQSKTQGVRHQRHLGAVMRKKASNTIVSNSNSNSETGQNGVCTLILCPTRELAFQISGVIEELIEGMSANSKNNRDSLDVVVVTGGVPMEPQIEVLASKKLNNEPIDILIATPGRLADVLQRAEKEDDTTEKELEKKLLAALDEIGGKDVSLSLAKLDEMKINESIANKDDGGRSAISDLLSGVKYLVLDEADRLLSQGFKADIDQVLTLLPKPSYDSDDFDSSYNNDSQSSTDFRMKTLLFSATFPEQIQPRVEKVLRILSGKNASPPVRLSCALAGDTQTLNESSSRQRKRMERTTQPQAILEGPASTIDLRAIRVEERDRTQALLRLINEYGTEKWDRVLVFVATRYASEHVAKKLRRYNIKSTELHGKLDQDARIRRLEDFRKGKTRVLIATDLASRGLDVVGLPAVINYDLPRSTADFTHRIGRTGRAGKEGIAVTFLTPTNEAHYNLIEKRHLKGSMVVQREVLKGLEPNEDNWAIQSEAAMIQVNGVQHSDAGLAHDRMFGGIKGRRKSKKDKLREKAAKEAEGL